LARPVDPGEAFADAESGHLVEKRSSKGGESRGISAINETLRAMEGCLTVPAGETSVV
jgi:hypothetical protein